VRRQLGSDHQSHRCQESRQLDSHRRSHRSHRSRQSRQWDIYRQIHPSHPSHPSRSQSHQNRSRLIQSHPTSHQLRLRHHRCRPLFQLPWERHWRTKDPSKLVIC
jgi:hypothetical protein